jgi:YEATS-Like-Associating Three TM
MPEPIPAAYIMLIVGVMILSGALGGIVSALLSAREDRLFLGLVIKHTFIGIVGALTVPLLLNMVSSDLLESGYLKPLKLLTLISLCIIFSVFSTRILERIFRSRSEDEDKHSQEPYKRRDEPERTIESTVKAIHISSPDKAIKMENQSKILQSLAGAEDSKMSLADLMRNTEMSQKDFDETLSLLMAKGSIAQVLSSGNKLQLVLTARGRQQLSKASAN